MLTNKNRKSKLGFEIEYVIRLFSRIRMYGDIRGHEERFRKKMLVKCFLSLVFYNITMEAHATISHDIL